MRNLQTKEPLDPIGDNWRGQCTDRSAHHWRLLPVNSDEAGRAGGFVKGDGAGATNLRGI